MKIGLIAGTARKNEGRMEVKDLYAKSPLFRYSLSYCLENYDSTLVISAEHGLLELDTILDPYDQSLANIQRKDFKEWLNEVSKQIKILIPSNSSLYFHTGNRFRRLINYLPEYHCFEPMKGKGIGQQLKYLKEVSKGDESL